jgi:hypothetical protein
MLACRRVAALTVASSLLTVVGSAAETVKSLLATYHEDPAVWIGRATCSKPSSLAIVKSSS